MVEGMRIKPPNGRLAVLLSGTGSTMQNLHDHTQQGVLKACGGEIACVIGSKPGLIGLEKASKLGLNHRTIGKADHPEPEARSAAIFEAVRQCNAGLVVLAGYLYLLNIPDDFHGRVVNVHPSLLPSFGGRGMYGQHVHQAVLDAGCKVSGCTVHLADDRYDTGPILAQSSCAVEPGDDAVALSARVQAIERQLYPQVLADLIAGRYELDESTGLAQLT